MILIFVGKKDNKIFECSYELGKKDLDNIDLIKNNCLYTLEQKAEPLLCIITKDKDIDILNIKELTKEHIKL